MTSYLRVLEQLADGRFHAGPALAASLGVSRAAVWKAVQRLAGLGVEVHAVRGRGYRLAAPLELLDAARIEAAVGPRARALLRGIEVHREIDSTNRHLMQRAYNGAGSGLACLADSQRAGRGRRGRSWYSPLGHNLYLSLLWRYAHGPEVLSGCSLAVGVVLAQLLQELGLQQVRLKWPNDLLCGGRKLGGILLETAGESGGPCSVVVGIGLNLRMPGQGVAIDQPWTDLASALGERAPPLNRLAGAVLERLLPLLDAYPASGFAAYQAEWRRFDALAGARVALQLGERTVHGECRGVDASGALLLLHDGVERRYHGGEASLRPAP
ncbi:MAG TPA: bifunctional biotin--[acetyl-CoA-carboxylase] ligase/biotin operon repressor BirA [Gammaproteobacteria bacterium]